VIASVSGTVLHKGLDHVIVEAAGVGYQLSVSSNTLSSVPPDGSQVTLLATLVVREDSMQLFGFAAGAERDLFALLTGVSGVGPKVALAVLSGMTVGEVESSLIRGDHAAFQKIPGIGKRTAERLVVELKDKVVPGGEPVVRIAGAEGAIDSPVMLAREGLLSLGYPLQDAEQMLVAAEGETAEALIGSALRQVAQR
jgi:Holliday junction DNA helicase RuvA